MKDLLTRHAIAEAWDILE